MKRRLQEFAVEIFSLKKLKSKRLFGRQDKPIPLKWARRFYDLFSWPKKIAFYDAGHALNREARMERVLNG